MIESKFSLLRNKIVPEQECANEAKQGRYVGGNTEEKISKIWKIEKEFLREEFTDSTHFQGIGKGSDYKHPRFRAAINLIKHVDSF